MLPRVHLLPKRAKPFFARHPWVFAGAIRAVEGEPADGDEVELVGHAGTFIARGFYNSRSKIRVRLYSWQDGRALDRDFFEERITAALRLRTHLGLVRPNAAFRLVNSEGDGLSGLTVDVYGTWAVMQLTSLGMANRRDVIADVVRRQLSCEGVYVRTEKGVGKLEGLELHDGPLVGTPPTEPIVVEERGLKIALDLAAGQKTGYYLDQRDNRVETARLAFGRRVLDAFCYSGGFSLQAARHGAAEVIGIDGSEAALALARRNAALNGIDNATFVKADAFDELELRADRGEQFGLVVLDPPKFARGKDAVDDAMRGYRRLKTLAMKLLEPDGYLTTCCCTGLITPDMLEGLLAQVGADARRDVQILQRRGAAPDHPVAASCPESHYLKCLIARVR